MRTVKVGINLAVSWLGQLAMILLKFIARIVFLACLSKEYLGINGILNNILSILSLAELGIGTAINYSLYKPLAEKNKKKIIALMQLYKKVYTYIGFFILVFGMLLAPFIKYIIKELDSIPNIYLIYQLYVFNSGISYFFSYKSALLIADQKNYIKLSIHYLVNIILNILQMIVLWITKNFILFTFIQVVATITENIIVSSIVDKKYPFLKREKKYKIDKSEIDIIIKNTKAMIFHKIGAMIVLSTDSLIISSFINIVSVGIYSNYKLICDSVNAIVDQLFSVLIPSIGNLKETSNDSKITTIFFATFFINFWVYGFCSISILILINPFISIWLGEDLLFSHSFVVIQVINFYVMGMRKSALIFRDALGLYWYDRYKPLFESLINLVLSIILVKNFGIVGVFIGTLISTILTCFWVEPYILFKYGFNKSVKIYFVKYGLYTLIVILAAFITNYFANLITVKGFMELFFKGIICVIIPNSIFLICFCWTKEFKYIIKKAKELYYLILSKMSKRKTPPN